MLLKEFPSPFGHEFAGTVLAIGSEDNAGPLPFQVGDRVVAANSAPCGTCFFCEKEQPNLCEQLDLLNGAYADAIRIPARIARRNTFLLPPDLRWPWPHLPNLSRSVFTGYIRLGSRRAIGLPSWASDPLGNCWFAPPHCGEPM